MNYKACSICGHAMVMHVCEIFCLVDGCKCGPWKDATEQEAYFARHSEAWTEAYKRADEKGISILEAAALIWKEIQERKSS